MKIYDYHFKLYYGKEDFTPVIHGNAFSEKSGARHYTKVHMDPPAFRSAPAFPLLSEAVSDQRAAGSRKDSGTGIQDSEISCQESGQDSAVSGQDSGSRMQDSESGNQESDQGSVANGQKTEGSDAKGALPEAEHKDSAVGSEVNNSEGNEVRDSETAGADHTGDVVTCSADAGMSKAKQVPVDPAVLNQLSKQFTRDEMVQMILDPEFVRRRPKLAGTLYYILYGDSQFLEPWIKNSG